MPKEYHIVYGEQAQAVLIESESVDFDSEDVELITLQDNLAEGSLFDIKTLVGFEDRSKWFEDFYGVDQWASLRLKNVEDCILVLGKIQDDDKVYLWLGDEGNEYVWKAALLDFLKDVCASIYGVDWNKLTFYKQDGGEMKLYALNLCSPENAVIAGSNFRIITNGEREDFVVLWNKILQNNSDLRVLNNTVLEEVDISFFDEMLLNRCTSEFQNGAYVVGMTLCDIYEKYKGAGIGDFFLFERLEQMFKFGKLEIAELVNCKPNAANWFKVRLVN